MKIADNISEINTSLILGKSVDEVYDSLLPKHTLGTNAAEHVMTIKTAVKRVVDNAYKSEFIGIMDRDRVLQSIDKDLHEPIEELRKNSMLIESTYKNDLIHNAECSLSKITDMLVLNKVV
jgi:hypothetical protein